MMIKPETRSKVQGGGDNQNKKNNKNNAAKREQKKDENWKKTPPKEEKAHKKKVKGRTWRWCKHHMAWGNRKESDCQLGKDRTSQQNSNINQVTTQAASETILNPEWQALMANMARNTGQTRMETMDNLLVSFHGGGKLIQGTSRPDLPYTSIFPNHPVLAPHQVGGSLP
jgi:hypothetical protein